MQTATAQNLAIEESSEFASRILWGVERDEDSSKSLKTAIAVSLVLHILLMGAFLTMNKEISLTKTRETPIIALKDVEHLFRAPARTITPLEEVKAMPAGTGLSVKKQESPQKPKTKLKRKVQPEGFGQLSLAASGADQPTLLLPTPGMGVSSKQHHLKIGLKDALASAALDDGAPIRLVSLNRVSGHELKGKIAEKVKVSQQTQVQIVRKEVEVHGGLEDSVVRRIIEERLSSIRVCYETSLLQSPDLKGEVQVSWTIQPNGNVSDLISESQDIPEGSLHSCLKDRMSQWMFPAPKGGGIVNVKYPFVFSRVNG